MTSAYTKLENSLGVKSTGRCSACVKDVSIESFEEMKKYITNFLGIAAGADTKEETATSGLDISFSTVADDYGYLRFVLEGQTLEDIVVSAAAVINLIIPYLLQNVSAFSLKESLDKLLGFFQKAAS